MAEMLSIETGSGVMRAHAAHPAGPPRGAVVVLHEIFGINPDMRATCQWLADCGFLAVCPDLFWRLEPGVSLTDRTDGEWKRALALYTAFDREVGLDDATRTVAAVRALCGPSVGVGVMGYCLGGLMTYRYAALRGADAAVAYYGGSTERYLHEAGTLRSPLMLHLAGADEYMPGEAQQAIRAALADRPGVEIHGYPGQRHAFARNAGAHHDAAAATLANERTRRFFYQHLGPRPAATS